MNLRIFGHKTATTLLLKMLEGLGSVLKKSDNRKNPGPSTQSGNKGSIIAQRQTGLALSMRGSAPLIRVENVTKRFGDFVALDAINLDVYGREFFSMLGPSGCGKTTLLRIMAGLEEPTEGRIFLDGQDITAVPAHERPVNMMFQSYALFPHMNVADNIAFGLTMAGLSRNEIRSRVEALLHMVKLDTYGGRRPDQLSGGQKQRVALARAIARRPRVLLLDEPLAALDRKLRAETQFELMNIQYELGITFVVITHDQEEALVMSDRIAVMKAGRISQIATPKTLYEHPQNRHVATFLGDVTLIEATITQIGPHQITLRSHDTNGIHVTAHQPGFSIGQTVTLAYRPENIVLIRAPANTDLPNRVLCIVDDIAYLGKSVSYNLKMPNGTPAKLSEQSTNLRHADQISWGDTVAVSFPDGCGVILYEE